MYAKNRIEIFEIYLNHHLETVKYDRFSFGANVKTTDKEGNELLGRFIGLL